MIEFRADEPWGEDYPIYAIKWDRYTSFSDAYQQISKAYEYLIGEPIEEHGFSQQDIELEYATPAIYDDWGYDADEIMYFHRLQWDETSTLVYALNTEGPGLFPDLPDLSSPKPFGPPIPPEPTPIIDPTHGGRIILHNGQPVA
jgi:hypothetical protein